jgi:hypothetical protein
MLQLTPKMRDALAAADLEVGVITAWVSYATLIGLERRGLVTSDFRGPTIRSATFHAFPDFIDVPLTVRGIELARKICTE